MDIRLSDASAEELDAAEAALREVFTVVKVSRDYPSRLDRNPQIRRYITTTGRPEGETP